MTIDELTKKFETLQTGVDVMKKDFELKLENANKDVATFKAIALKKEDELKEFKEKAELAIKEKDKAFAESRKAENLNFLETLKKDAKISPAMAETAAKLMESMTSEVVVATFDAKDGKKIQHTQLSLFKELLASLSKAPVFRSMSQATVATREIPAGTGTEGEKQFVTVKREGGENKYEVDGTELHAAALQFQEDQRKIGRATSYEDALVAAEKILQAA